MRTKAAEHDGRAEAIAVMAWGIGRGMGDCRMIAQEKGHVGAAYPDERDTTWRVYKRYAAEGYDALIAAGFSVTAPTVFGGDAGGR